jgi:DNA-binding PadR family transcriptional regulator
MPWRRALHPEQRGQEKILDETSDGFGGRQAGLFKNFRCSQSCPLVAVAEPAAPTLSRKTSKEMIGSLRRCSTTKYIRLTYIRYGYILAVGMANNQANAPLTPAVLHILLVLSTQERHGYGIMKQVESDSQGKVKMGPGTLYGSLGRMIDAGLIRESDKKVDPKMDDERRVYYRITALGQKALAAELQRYRDVVAVARGKRLSPNALSYGYDG